MDQGRWGGPPGAYLGFSRRKHQGSDPDVVGICGYFVSDGIKLGAWKKDCGQTPESASGCSVTRSVRADDPLHQASPVVFHFWIRAELARSCLWYYRMRHRIVWHTVGRRGPVWPSSAVCMMEEKNDQTLQLQEQGI